MHINTLKHTSQCIKDDNNFLAMFRLSKHELVSEWILDNALHTITHVSEKVQSNKTMLEIHFALEVKVIVLLMKLNLTLRP